MQKLLKYVRYLLYALPAVVMLLFYALLALPHGSGGFNWIIGVYLIAPLLAAVLLLMGKWWGCVFGIAFGGMFIYETMEYSAWMVIDLIPFGIFFIAYFVVMGLVCYKSQKKSK